MHDLRKEFGQLQSDYNRAINNFGVILSRLQLSKDGTKVIAPRSEDFVPVLEGFFTVLGEIATKTGRLLEEALSHKEIIDSNYHSKAVASPKSDSWNCLSYEPKHISHEIDIMVGRLKMAAKTNINLLKVPRNKHEKTKLVALQKFMSKRCPSGTIEIGELTSMYDDKQYVLFYKPEC